MSDRKRIRAYRAALEHILGRELARRDGVPEARLAKAERRLGRPLPSALRDYLALAGLAPETLARSEPTPRYGSAPTRTGPSGIRRR